MGLPTPDTGHLRETSYSTVYEPAEDTYLLLDALENDRQELQDQRPTLCVEIGPGSGCVSAFLGQCLDPQAVLILSVDLNEAATRATQETTRRVSTMAPKAIFEQSQGRFLQGYNERIRGQVDILIFNPPYVVTPSEEVDVSVEAAAWAGGVRGREVLDLLLPQVSELLADNGGRFYLVVIEQNDPLEIIEYLGARGLEGKRVLERKAGREHLSILRFMKKMNG